VLARRQRVEALFEVTYFFLPFTSFAVFLQGDANSVQQVLVAEWFGQKFNGASLHRSNTHGNIAVTGDEDYRHMAVSRRKLALKIEAT
jgi:hypothetical protein